MKNERYEKIMNILAERGYASVDRLSKELFVSMPTVRRDLNTMQDIGLVVRSHGGVMPRLSDMDGGPAVFRMRSDLSSAIRRWMWKDLSEKKAEIFCTPDTGKYMEIWKIH